MLNNLILSVLMIIALNGCSVKEYFTLGKEKSVCEEEGCDYSDAGVCLNPYDVIKNKNIVRVEAYRIKDKEEQQ